MKKNIKSMKDILAQLNYVLDRRQKKKAVLVLLIIIISSFVELLGVTSILPLVQVMLEPDTLMRQEPFATVVSLFHITTASEMIILCGCAVAVVFIVKNIFLLFSAYIQADYSTKTQKQLSVKMLAAYMERPYVFFLDVNSAEILRGIRDDTVGVYNIVSIMFQLVAETLTIAMIGVYIIYADFFIAFGVILLIGIITIGMLIVIKPRMKNAGEKNRLAILGKNKYIYQAVTGIKEISVLQRKRYFVEQYKTAADLGRKTQRTYDFIIGCPERIIEAFCVGGLIIVVCLRVAFSDNIVDFIPKLATFAVASFRMLPSAGKITNRMAGIVFNRPALQNVYDVLHNFEVDDTKNQSLDDDNQKIVFNEKIELRNVTWRYPNGVKEILTNADLEIKKGKSVALIGASGAGKTTAADILLGLFNPLEGNVYVDGKPISKVPKDWSKLVSYVPQVMFMLDDSIKNNVAFGIKAEDIDETKVWEALEQAQISEYIKTLPEGLETRIGEAGIKFSGGQRQRISIARALYNNPDILVLDEATSALDTETEQAIMEAIEGLYGKKTLVIVAHRLSTIKNCDAIYEVGNGKIEKRSKKEIFGE